MRQSFRRGQRPRDGTRNRYEVQLDLPMRHPLIGDRSIRELVELYASAPEGRTRRFERRRSPTAAPATSS